MEMWPRPGILKHNGIQFNYFVWRLIFYTFVAWVCRAILNNKFLQQWKSMYIWKSLMFIFSPQRRVHLADISWLHSLREGYSCHKICIECAVIIFDYRLPHAVHGTSAIWGGPLSCTIFRQSSMAAASSTMKILLGSIGNVTRNGTKTAFDNRKSCHTPIFSRQCISCYSMLQGRSNLYKLTFSVPKFQRRHPTVVGSRESGIISLFTGLQRKYPAV